MPTYTTHIEGSQLVLQPRFAQRHADVHLNSEGDNTLCIGANHQTQLRLNSAGVTATQPLRQDVEGIPRPLLHVANLHEQTDAVFGHSTATLTTPAHAPGLVPPGSPTHNGECLLKNGLFGHPSIHTGAVSESLLMLNDTPSTYEAAHGHFLRVSTSSAVEFVDLAQAIQGTPLDSITVTSDINAKTGVVPYDLDEATTTFKGITPVKFQYLSDPDKTKVGVLAQEVERVMPCAVTQPQEDGQYKRVDYVALVGLLHATLHAVLKRVDTLEERLTELGDLVGSIGRQDE